MATRKAVIDPLTEELPPASEPRPENANDVTFEIQISPYVVTGKTYYRWTLLDHNHKGYVGDYSNHNESGFEHAVAAEGAAAEYVDRIRQAVDLKLGAPESYIIKL